MSTNHIHVWRIERVCDDRGPFQDNGPLLYDQLYNTSPEHRNPEYEGLTRKPGLYCGVESLERLRHWFGYPKVIQKLKKLFRVVLLRVPSKHVQQGKTQLLFMRKYASMVRVYRIEDLL